MEENNTNIRRMSTNSTVSEGTTKTNKFLYGSIAAGVVFVSFFIGAFASMSNFLGSKDDWNVLKPQLVKIWVLVLLGTIAFMIASLLYFYQDPQKSILFTIVMTVLSLGLSFSALSVAAISR
jgi:hypothetical protein